MVLSSLFTLSDGPLASIFLYKVYQIGLAIFGQEELNYLTLCCMGVRFSSSKKKNNIYKECTVGQACNRICWEPLSSTPPSPDFSFICDKQINVYIHHLSQLNKYTDGISTIQNCNSLDN